MPDSITFDDAFAGPSAQRDAITFDDAMSARESQLRPGGQRDVRPGEMLTPGSGLPGSPNYQPSMVGPRPLPADDANFGAAFKFEFAADQKTKLRLVAESLGVPEDRVGIVDGRPVIVNDNGELQYASGPWSRMAASAVASAPEIAGGVVGSFAAGQPIAGASLGAAGGRALKRGISELVFDEPATAGSIATEMAIEGGVNLLSGGTAKGVSALANRSKIIDFTPKDVHTAEQARAFFKSKLGIDLDLAQASGDRKLLALRDYAARYPGKAADMVQAADDIAEGQLDTATNRVLDLVAKAESSEVVGRRGVNAAQTAIKLAREKIYNDVDPLYKAAYAAVPEVTDPAVLDLLKLPRFPQALAKAKEAMELETGEKLADDAPMSLQLLDHTKRMLDDEVQSLRDSGARQMAALLEKRRNDFVAALDAIPNQQWQLARKRYGELIEKTVKPMEEGIVGVIAGISDQKAATAAAKIFSDPNITANEIRYAKAKISQQDPEAWKGLVRQWLGQKWNAAMKETQSGDVTNPAGKFRQAVFGTPSDQRKIQTMLPPGAAADFDALMGAMEKLARTPLGASRVAGSPTASNQLITESLKGRVSWLMDLLRPREAALNAAEQRALDQGVESITQALFDPAKRSQLKQIVKMQPSTRQAILISSLLGGQAIQGAVENEMAIDQLPASSP